jgi:hypothetical protein
MGPRSQHQSRWQLASHALVLPLTFGSVLHESGVVSFVRWVANLADVFAYIDSSLDEPFVLCSVVLRKVRDDCNADWVPELGCRVLRVVEEVFHTDGERESCRGFGINAQGEVLQILLGNDEQRCNHVKRLLGDV